MRRWMDGLDRAAQGKPVLSDAVRRLRGAMRWFVSGALRRSDLERARALMADAPAQPVAGPKVVFLTLRRWLLHVAVDVSLAQALRLRGARCEFFFCGGGLPICEVGWSAAAEDPCASCGSSVADMVDAAQFPRHSLDDMISEEERRAIAVEVGASTDEPVRFRGRALDPLVDQSLMWFFRTAMLPDTDQVARARHDFRVGAAIIAAAAPRLLDALAPDVLVVLNGLFYEDRIIREEAQARGIRVVTYEAGAQAGTVFFAAGGVAPDNDISDLWNSESSQHLSEAAEQALEGVLAARRRGTGLPHRYHGRRVTPTQADVPTVAVFTNVSWDTAVSGRTLGFDSMFEWVAETVRIAQEHPELRFVIRAHPAESQVAGRESRDRVTDFVRRTFPTLPANLRLIEPEDPFDSYALFDSADIVAVYTSTIGLEAAAAGKPVCVAGKAHYVDHGFTTDIADPNHYRQLFDDLSWTKPDARKRDLARRYAHLYFCRAMIPLRAVADETPGRPTFAFASIADLAPGHDPDLDLICNGILGDGPIRGL
jgi:hypothetical protein